MVLAAGKEGGRSAAGGRAGACAPRCGRGCPKLPCPSPDTSAYPGRLPCLLSRLLPRSLRVFHTPFHTPLPLSPPPSTPPGLSPSPSFLLPPEQRFESGALPLPLFPPARACGAAAGERPLGRGGTRPAARPGACRPCGAGGRRWGPAIAIASPRGATWGKGSGAATSVLPALPAGSRCGAGRAARARPLPPERGWSLRPQSSVHPSLFSPEPG